VTSKVARWWKAQQDGKVRCELCERRCLISPGGFGYCHVRQNEQGTLFARSYGLPTGFAVDPIEKKPLAHFYPGMSVLSFGTVGCNLGCRFCQNWSLSKAKLGDRTSVPVTPEAVVALAKEHDCPGLSYTYNEPIIWGEVVADVARLARASGLKNVMVTNGYITPEARKEVFADIDAANVDLKAFSERFYEDLTCAHLAPVLETLRWLVHETQVWTEITTLLIPGENDSAKEIEEECRWIARELDVDVPVHFTAFHPDFELRNKPRTPPATLALARDLAKKQGLAYVYVGNVADEDGHSTCCPGCGAAIIRRDWHEVLSYDLEQNRCRFCRTEIAGRFSDSPLTNSI